MKQFEVLNLTLSAIVDTEIIFDEPVTSIVIKNQSADDLYLRAAESDAAFWTIFGRTQMSFDLPRTVERNVGFLRAAIGSGPAEIFGLKVR